MTMIVTMSDLFYHRFMSWVLDLAACMDVVVKAIVTSDQHLL